MAMRLILSVQPFQKGTSVQATPLSEVSAQADFFTLCANGTADDVLQALKKGSDVNAHVTEDTIALATKRLLSDINETDTEEVKRRKEKIRQVSLATFGMLI